MSAKECKSKRRTTEKMIAANRANAQKSTGPRTAVGKDIARRNSLKHGMTSAGTVLPKDLETQVKETTAKWVDQLHPEGYVELTLIKQAVASSVKLEWLDKQFNLMVAKQTRDAAGKFDDRERKGALLEAQGLAENPFETVELLKNSVPGCAWLIEEWTGLQESLEDGLNDDQIAQALRLLGIDPAADLTQGQINIRKLLVQTQTNAERPLGPDGTPVEADAIRQAVHSLIEESIESLKSRIAELAPTHETFRSQSQASAMLPFGKSGALWPRYQGVNAKEFHQSLHDLIKIRKHDNPPRPDDFRRDADKERARNEAVRNSYSSHSSSTSGESRAELSAELEAQNRRSRKTAKALELLELQNEAKAALIRREERLGRRAPNEAVSNPQVVKNTVVATKKTNPIGQVLKVACILLALLLGASATGSSQPETEDKTIQANPVPSVFSNATSIETRVLREQGPNQAGSLPFSPASSTIRERNACKGKASKTS